MDSSRSQETESTEQLRQQLITLGLPNNLLNELVDHHTLVNYTPDSIIFTQRSSADLLFWILGGVVRLRCRAGNGRSVTLALATRGEILGYAVTIDAANREVGAFEARAFTRCSLALVPRDLVRTMLLKSDARTLTNLIQAVNRFWSSSLTRSVSLMGMSIRDRFKFVMRELGERFGVTEDRGTFLPLNLEHQDLAEMIGGSRSMVTRLVAEFTSQGALVTAAPHRYVLIRDRELFIESPSEASRPHRQQPSRPGPVAKKIQPVRLLDPVAIPRRAVAANGKARPA